MRFILLLLFIVVIGWGIWRFFKNKMDINSNSTPKFTALEFLASFTILVVLSTIFLPDDLNYSTEDVSLSEISEQEISAIVQAIVLYQIDLGSFPEEKSGLIVLTQNINGNTRWNGPYLSQEHDIYDPWKRLYKYKRKENGAGFEILSLGADNLVGGEGEDRDISYHY